MRGLTADERHWLALPSGIHTEDADDDGWRPVLMQLYKDGRVKHWEDQEGYWWPNTDLGNLALRVCPVDES